MIMILSFSATYQVYAVTQFIVNLPVNLVFNSIPLITVSLAVNCTTITVLTTQITINCNFGRFLPPNTNLTLNITGGNLAPRSVQPNLIFNVQLGLTTGGVIL